MKISPKTFQSSLKAQAFYRSGEDASIDGLWGLGTQHASEDWFDSGEELILVEATPPPSGDDPLPPDWLPDCSMKRIHIHWTAGSYTPSEDDLEHYHFIVGGDGKIQRGKHSIADNVSTSDGDYAAHTKDANTGAIGVSAACMAGAIQSPFNAGKYPLKPEQWSLLADIAAQLCRKYKIGVTSKTVLQHGEVQQQLGISQSGKWDITALPWDPNLDAGEVCDQFRGMVIDRL
jgi:hypothetical protein